eukprot:6913941-Prymnesium_polylepis.1
MLRRWPDGTSSSSSSASAAPAVLPLPLAPSIGESRGKYSTLQMTRASSPAACTRHELAAPFCGGASLGAERSSSTFASVRTLAGSLSTLLNVLGS